MTRLLALPLLLALVACDSSAGTVAPGAASADEAKAVGEAAAMLDERGAQSDAPSPPPPQASSAP